MEIWKDIPNYEGYQASNLGRIRTHNKISYTKRHGERHWKDRILHFKNEFASSKNKKQGMGYRVDLWKDGKPHTFLVHRLVATTFLENLIETDMTVNHKDGNRYNNNIENLEWLTKKENIQYGFENGQYQQIGVCLLNTKSKETKEFKSMAKASSFLGKSADFIGTLKRKNKTHIKMGEIEYEITYK